MHQQTSSSNWGGIGAPQYVVDANTGAYMYPSAAAPGGYVQNNNLDYSSAAADLASNGTANGMSMHIHTHPDIYTASNYDSTLGHHLGYADVRSAGFLESGYDTSVGHYDPAAYHIDSNVHTAYYGQTSAVPVSSSVVNGTGKRRRGDDSAEGGKAVAGTGTEVEEEVVTKCHLHSKPQLICKFCRKYKRAVHQQARLAQVQALRQPETEEKRNIVEMTNQSSYNMNNLLRENILCSEYFKSLFTLKTFNELVDEIYQYATHAEPYCAGHSRAPSTLFCCLYKLLAMKLTERQVTVLLDHGDSPFIRVTGFLYLRYVHPPEKLWDWFEAYVLDDEEFAPGVDKHRVITIGEYVEGLITDDKYYATVLPRLPVKIKTQYGAQLMAMTEHRKRKRQNKNRLNLFVENAKVTACSNGDWLDGEVIELQDTYVGREACLLRLEDDSEEVIDLGLIILKRDDDHKKSKQHGHVSDADRYRDSRSEDRRRPNDRRHDSTSASVSRTDTGGSRRYRESNRSRSRDRVGDGDPGYKPRYRSISPDDSHRAHVPAMYEDDAADGRNEPKSQEELVEEFRRRESAKAVASGKDYARRPTSYKSCLSRHAATGISTRKRSGTGAASEGSARVIPVISSVGVETESSGSQSLGASSSNSTNRSAGQGNTSQDDRDAAQKGKQRMAQLMEKYTVSSKSSQPTNRGDVEAPDVLRLG
eukprot:Lankesteria_metandrocarpae@DN2891_c0_g1_i1.p1